MKVSTCGFRPPLEGAEAPLCGCSAKAHRNRFGLALIMMGLLVGCGSTEQAASMAVHIPWQAPLEDCPFRPSFADMSATLLIGGGFPPCALTVSQADLSVSGTCPDITTQTVRPMMLVYALPHASGTPSVLALNIGFVNLCADVIDSSETVSVNLSNDGTNSVIIYEAGAVASLEGAASLPSCRDRLPEAIRWAKDTLDDDFIGVDPLDRHGNNISNLEEACAGTL